MTIERPLKIAGRIAVRELLSLAHSQQDKLGVDFRIGSTAEIVQFLGSVSITPAS